MLLLGRFNDIGNDDPERIYDVGIFGGTFDPVHTGHLAAAERVREEAKLDCVLFMPAGVPVFKLDQAVTPGAMRLEMCCQAVESNPFFDVSDIEVQREGNTYTYETLRELRCRFPRNVRLHFIAGADAILTVGKWRNASELAQLAHFIGMTRPGYDEYDSKLEIRAGDCVFDIDFCEVPGLNISSSHIRERVSHGGSVRYLVPDAVASYIGEHALYQS